MPVPPVPVQFAEKPIRSRVCSSAVSELASVLMTLIEAIREKVLANDFEFSQHAVDQTILRRISVREIREAFGTGKVIEDYPDDKYSPSCLVLGFTAEGKAIHVQCSHPSRSLLKIITVYEPDPNEWIGNEQRRG